MDRATWLQQIRAKTEALYDHLAPRYWRDFGCYTNAAHRAALNRFLQRLPANSALLDAACGAGRYDGPLLEAGHRVLGIDQSARMLARAREHFPQARYTALSYTQMGLQEMAFETAFDGAVCMDAMEHICPEDWPGILARFHRALKPGGVLYLTVEVEDPDEVSAAYERARAQGLPVVEGEMVDTFDAAYERIMAAPWQEIPREIAAQAAYHFYPPQVQVRAWFEGAELPIEEEISGDGYAHILARRAGQG